MSISRPRSSRLLRGLLQQQGRLTQAGYLVDPPPRRDQAGHPDDMIAAAPHLAASLNANYYITIAAVIPTLFIAIGVQGGAFDEVSRTAMTAALPFARGAAGLIQSRTGLARFALRAVGYLYGTMLVLLAGAGLLLAGLAGEGIALWALFSGKDNVVFRVCTLAASILLVIAAGLQPVRTLSKPFVVLFKVATARPSTADEALKDSTSQTASRQEG